MGTDVKTKTSILDHKTVADEQLAEKSGKGSGLSGENSTPLDMFLEGTLNEGQTMMLNNTYLNKKLSATVTGKMPFNTAKGEYIGPSTLYKMLGDGNWNYLVDSSKIKFGNKIVSTGQFNDIIFDGQSDIARVYLPSNPDGSADTESLNKFNSVIEIYKTKKSSMSVPQIRRLFAANGFNVSFDREGNIDVKANGTELKPYVVA